ncbi:hypothetical protein AeRB84_009691 [Aphanomyces euteiches]|nr:hypothetical protein AeRB84_009691 [Aphanomyces euteiches]
MLESYVHTLLKSILGTYVNLNEDDEALRVSVWEGQVELRDLMLQCHAFEPLCKDLPFSVHAGCIGYFKLQVPLMNLGGQPIQVHVKEVFILLRPRQPSKLAPNTSMPADAKAYLLQAKRATLQALEIEQEKDPNKAENSSTFVSRLLTKLLDNIQIHVERVHVRIEDAFSYPQAPYSCGITMDEVAIRSTDAGWNYTLNVRDSGASCLRKVFEIKRLGVYWSGSFNEVNDVNDVNALSSGMGRTFLQQTSCPYICEPMTLSMKLLMNDRGDMIPLTFKEFTQRVMSRLGISWMVETIEAIGEEAWSSFVSRMPPLVGGRSYTLSFVFAEAWSVALEHIMREDEEDDPIPTLEDFKAALRSCFQWSDLDAISPSIAKYREAAIYVLQEKSTYLTIEAQVDDFSLRVEQSQYHSILAFLSLLSFRQRQLKYAHLRPVTSVHANPTAWWHFCIEAVIIDTRARLRKIDWEYVRKKKMQKRRYVELYIELHDHENSPEYIRMEYNTLEYDMDNKDILVCRAEAKKRIAEIQTRRAPPASSYLSYSYWFGSNNTDPSKRELEKEYFYDAIDYDPNEINPNLLDSRIKYRVQLELQKFRTEIIQGMCTLVTLHGSNMSLELSRRQDNTNLLMEVSEFEMEEPLNTCKISRLPMDIVMQNKNAHEISGVRLRLCEKPLPLISCKIELPQIGNVQADLGITFISQPMQAFFDMPFVLSVASFFKAPPSIDLSDIDAAAWERAKTFSKFSAAQLRQAIATRTKVCLNVDITSPIVTLTEKSLTEEPVVVTMYFGHFRAISKLQPNIDIEGYENSKAEFLAKLPEEQLHDQVQLLVRGVQIGLNGEMPLLERADAECTLKTSVAPDPTIPLMKINGNMCSLSLHLSSTGYDKLRRLLTSLSDNIVDQFPTLPQTEWKEEKTTIKSNSFGLSVFSTECENGFVREE